VLIDLTVLRLRILFLLSVCGCGARYDRSNERVLCGISVGFDPLSELALWISSIPQYYPNTAFFTSFFIFVFTLP
jgi:hypothetical protein